MRTLNKILVLFFAATIGANAQFDSTLTISQIIDKDQAQFDSLSNVLGFSPKGFGDKRRWAQIMSQRYAVNEPLIALPKTMEKYKNSINNLRTVSNGFNDECTLNKSYWQSENKIDLPNFVNGNYSKTSQSGNTRPICMEFDPINENIIYCGMYGGGIWKSLDGGENWVSLGIENNPELRSLSIASIAISKSNRNIIYAATGNNKSGQWPIYNTDGIYKSTNNGETWVKTNFKAFDTYTYSGNGTSNFYDFEQGHVLNYRIRDIIIDPDNVNHLYATVTCMAENWGFIPYQYRGYVMRSTDGGQTWENILLNGSYLVGDFYDMEFLPSSLSSSSSQKILYIAGKKIVRLAINNSDLTYSSSDVSNLFTYQYNGNTYNIDLNCGNDAAVMLFSSYLLTSSLSTPDKMYICLKSGVSMDGTCTSIDTKFRGIYSINDDMQNALTSNIVVPPTTSTSIYSYGDDFFYLFGYNFAANNLSADTFYLSLGTLAVCAKNNSTGIYEWLPSKAFSYYCSNGHVDVRCILPSKTTNSLYVGADGGCYFIPSWKKVSCNDQNFQTLKFRGKGLDAAICRDVSVSAAIDPDIVTSQADNGGFYLNSQTNIWYNFVPGDGIFSLIHPNGQYYILGSNGNNSLDQTLSYLKINSNSTSNLGSITSGRIYKIKRWKTDPNQVFITVNTNLQKYVQATVSSFPNTPTATYSVTNSNSTNIFGISNKVINKFVTAVGLYNSTGNSNPNHFAISYINTDRNNTNYRYSGINFSTSDPSYSFDAYCLFKTTNGGNTFINITPTSSNTEDNIYFRDFSIREIIYHPSNPDIMWISYDGYNEDWGLSQGVKILTTTDGGISWKKFNQGLFPFPITNFLIDENNGYLYAALDNVGVFVRNFNDPNDTWQTFDKNLPKGVILTKIFINNTNGRLYAALYGRGIWSTHLKQNYDLNNLTITSGTTTLTGHKTVLGNIIVKNGATLKITGSSTVFEFADHGQTGIPTGIVVEPGGKLYIENNALLTSLQTCPQSMWNGVEVRGIATETQQLNKQGVLYMNSGATIRNAGIAIRTHGRYYDSNGGYDDLNSTGGIIKLNGAKFINNRKCIEFLKYSKANSASTIINSSFEVIDKLPKSVYVDDNGRPLAAKEYISLWAIKGVRMEGITIATNPTIFAPVNRGTGIVSIDASYSLNRLKTTGNVYQNNLLSKLYRGVVAEATINSILVNADIRYTDFNNVLEGISGNMVMNTIESNTFDVPVKYYDNLTQKTYRPWAVYLDNSVGFDVNKNIITAQSADENFGVIIRNSDGNAGKVQQNDISSIYAGTQTEKNNQALDILCNTYTNNEKAWSLNPLSPNGLFKDQGLGGCGIRDNTIKAGNLFMDNCSGSGRHISSNLTNTYTYYYWGNPVETQPVCISGNMNSSGCGLPASTDASCGQSNPCTDPACINKLGSRVSESTTPAERIMYITEYIKTLRNFQDETRAIQALERLGYVEAKLLLIPTHIDRGEFTQAATVLASLPNTPEFEDFRNYHQILIDLGLQGSSVMQMSITQENSMRLLAQENSTVNANARALLQLTRNERIERTPEFVSAGNANRKLQSILPSSVTEAEQLQQPYLGDNYPNPFTKETQIEVFVTESNTTFEVKDVLGNTVYKQNLEKGKTQVVLNTEQISSGIYYYGISTLETKKMIKIH